MKYNPLKINKNFEHLCRLLALLYYLTILPIISFTVLPLDAQTDNIIVLKYIRNFESALVSWVSTKGVISNVRIDNI